MGKSVLHGNDDTLLFLNRKIHKCQGVNEQNIIRYLLPK